MSQIFAIGGGKGGSGKSFITANLGVLLSKKNHSVVVVDLDLGCSNLHTLLGIKNPRKGANDFLDKSVKNLHQVAVPTSLPKLSLISTMNCSMEIANLYHAQKLKLIKAIKRLPFDVVFLDLGAGTSYNTLDFFLAAEKGLFVFTPEPTSIENTFRFIKAIYLRKLKQILKKEPFIVLIQKMVDRGEDRKISSPAQVLSVFQKHDPSIGRMLERKLYDLRFQLLMNQFRKQTDPLMGERIATLCNRYFYSSFHFLGNVDYDERVHDAVSSQKIYVATYPYTITAMNLQKVADQVMVSENPAGGLRETSS